MESLRAFMERLGKVTLKIRNISPEVTMHHVVITLKPKLSIIQDWEEN